MYGLTTFHPVLLRGKFLFHTAPLFFPGLDGLPLPPPPALVVKVLDSWKYQQLNKAGRLQATLGVGQINIGCFDTDSQCASILLTH